MPTDLVPLVFTSGWASGINPYLVVLLTGLAGRFTDLGVPDPLSRTDVIVVAAVLTVVDFVVDKTAYPDSTWDVVNTAIRPTAGAALALLISGDATTLQQAVLMSLGGGTALASHLVKAGTRVAVNTSPEPVSNWAASVTEDAVVVGGLALAFAHPWIALCLVIGVSLLIAVAVWWVWRKVTRGLKRLLQTAPSAQATPPTSGP